MKKLLTILALLLAPLGFALAQTIGIIDNATPIVGGSTGQCVTKAANGTVSMASCGSGSGVTTFSAGTTGFTPSSATAGVITLAGTLGVANGGTGITAFGTGVATALGVNVGSAGSPVINGGALGTPSSATLSGASGLPVSTGISGFGTGVANALGVNVGSAGSPIVNGGVLGTPSSGVATNLTGTAAGLTSGNVTTNANLTGDVTSVGNAATLAASITSGTHAWNGIQTITTATTTSPSWEAAITGDNTSRIAIGMNSVDTPRLSAGPGNAARDTFFMRAGAANWQFGTNDAAAPVAQTLSAQNVVAGTSNTAGANWTFNGSRGTGTGAGGSIIFQTAPAGSTGSSQNTLTSILTLSPTQAVVANGTAALPSVTFTNDATTGIYSRSNTVLSVSDNGTLRSEFLTTGLRLLSTGVYGISSGAANTASDVAISRVSPGIMALGTGAAASTAGTLQLTTLTASGTIASGAPAGSSAGLWKLGALQTGAVTPDTTRSIYVDIGGTVYKLMVAQ